MREEYRLLGEFVRLVDERNRDLRIDNLQGVSITKEFVPSIANIIGTDLSTYKIVRTGQFAYGPVTSRNGDKVSIALLTGEDCIISSSYVPFEVYKPEELLPEYLMMWFRRSEFDRYARFMSNGSAREVFDWECMCNVELPVPPIEEQRRIVHDYKVITERIQLLTRLNDNLAAQLQIIFVKLFGAYTDDIDTILEREQMPQTLSDICSFISKGITPTYSDETNEMIINQKCINNNHINFAYVKYHIFKTKNEKWLKNGDVLINSTGTGTLGRSAQYWGESNVVTVDSHITIVRADNELYQYYIGVLCQMLQPIFENMQTGSTAQTDLPRERLKNMPIGIPNEQRLTLFNSIAGKTIIMINVNEEEIVKLEEMKNKLVSQIV